jgi:NTE family protein
VIRALVLSGGGAKGAYEAGAVSSLLQAQPFDIVVGTSIGAINAALTAQHNLSALEATWKSVSQRNLIQPLPTVARVEAFLNAFSDWQSLPAVAKVSHIPHLTLLWMQIGSKEALFSMLGAYDETPIEALLKQFADYNALQSTLIVSATDITTRTATAFYAFVGQDPQYLQRFPGMAGIPTVPITQLNYVDALQASAAIPGAFTPVQMNLGSTAPSFFVDGGVANNTPISLAIAAGADAVTVVFVDPTSNGGVSPAPRNLIDVANSCYDVMQRKILEDDFKLAAYTNALLDGGSGLSASMQQQLSGKRKIGLYYVRPQTALPLSVLDFSNQAGIDAAFAQGVADGKNPKPY